MNLNSLYRYIFVFLLSLSILTGCGGNSSSGGDSNGTAPSAEQNSSVDDNGSTPIVDNNQTKTKGYLIDSALQGVTYVCDEEENLTNANGMFECVKAPVTFKIGELTLGTLNAFTADGKVYLQDLLGVKRDTYSDEKLKLLARLVQSLDDDGNIATTITITKEVRDALTKKQNFNTMTEQQVRLLVEGIGKRFVEECEAVKHLGDSSVSCGSDGGYYVDTTPVSTPTPAPATQKNNYKITLKTTEKIAGYEVYLKFTNDTPTQSNAVMNNSFLGTTGRTVNDLGADINSSTKEVKFGGFTFGGQEGVTGDFDVMTLKSADGQSQITITKQSCTDKDANDIACDVEIVNN